jgi:hypothetical protein
VETAGFFWHSFRVPAKWLVEFVGQVVFCFIKSSLSTPPKVDDYRGVRTATSIVAAASAGRITQGPEPAEEYTEPLIP